MGRRSKANTNLTFRFMLLCFSIVPLKLFRNILNHFTTVREEKIQLPDYTFISAGFNLIVDYNNYSRKDIYLVIVKFDRIGLSV